MLPIAFTAAAKEFVSKQESVTFFIRVWGISKEGGIAVEIYDYDLRLSDIHGNPFSNSEVTEFSEMNVKLLIPSHHVDFVEGSIIDWTDNADYSEGPFVHGGFFQAVPNEVSAEGLLFSRGEVWEISERVLWPQYNPRVFADAGPGIASFLEKLGKDWFTHDDIIQAIQAGHNSIAEHGWLDDD